MMLKISKVSSGRHTDIQHPRFVKVEVAGQRRNGVNLLVRGEGRLSGTFSRNRIFIAFRDPFEVNLLKRTAAASERIYSKKSSPKANKFTKMLGFDGQHCGFCLSMAFKVRFRFAPKKTPFEQIVHVAPKPNKQIVVRNKIVCIPHCLIGCAFGWGYCVCLVTGLKCAIQSKRKCGA